MKKINLIFLFFFSVIFTTSVLAQNIGLNIGDKAPELNFWNPDSTQPIPLSSLQGKIVLVDFWASWCGPCRMENKNLVKTYDKYKNENFNGVNGFDIYSVSLDKIRSSWINAIQKDSLKWTSHVSDLQYWNSAPAQIYSINSIPNNYLLDANGIILGKNLRGAKLDSALDNLQNGVTDINQTIFGENRIAVFPNPASETITISIPSNKPPLQGYYEIYDLTGRKLERYKITSINQTISVKNYTNGIYFLKISDGNKIYSVKFIKE